MTRGERVGKPIASDLRALSDDDVAALHEQRDFLLASLDDLEREHDAGDIDDADYAALRDDYVARAAATLRAIEARRVRTAEPPAKRSKAVLWAVGIVLFAAIAGVSVAYTAGRRSDGDFATGDDNRAVAELIAQAETLVGKGDYDGAIATFTKALDEQPGNVRALTYRGWIKVQADRLDDGRRDIDQAVLVDPAFPDAHVFRSVLLLNDKNCDGAAAEYDAINVDKAPPIVGNLLSSFRLREGIIACRVAAKLLVASPPPLAQSGFTADEVRIAAEDIVEDDPSKLDSAVKLLSMVIEANPRDAKARASLGWMLGRASQGLTGDSRTQIIDRARRELDRAVELDPTYPYARVYRAFVAFAQGKPAEAEADLKAFDAGADKPQALVALIDNQGLRSEIAKALAK